jgi:hypothetical protein
VDVGAEANFLAGLQNLSYVAHSSAFPGRVTGSGVLR